MCYLRKISKVLNRIVPGKESTNISKNKKRKKNEKYIKFNFFAVRKGE